PRPRERTASISGDEARVSTRGSTSTGSPRARECCAAASPCFAERRSVLDRLAANGLALRRSRRGAGAVEARARSSARTDVVAPVLLEPGMASGQERLAVVDVLGTAEEQRGALVERGRQQIHDRGGAVARRTARLFGDERERRRLVEHAQLAVRVLRVAGVEVDPAVEQIA